MEVKGTGTDATDTRDQSGTDDEGTRHLGSRMEELLRLQPDALGAAQARGMAATQVAIRDLEAMEAQQGAVCSATPAKHRTCPRGSNRRQSPWAMAHRQQSGFVASFSDCLLRCARSSATARYGSSSTELNRRMPTRMYGGGAGEER